LAERPEDLLLRSFDARIQQAGDTAAGAFWPNETDRRTRFDVMLDVMASRGNSQAVLVDFGCGTGELLGHIEARGLTGITYIGVDRSEAALAHARAKFPDATFLNLDVTAPDAPQAKILTVSDGVIAAVEERSAPVCLSRARRSGAGR